MARPVSIHPDVILEAARKVFMAHGYKASTALIAKEAGISEGSLFKHYKSKCNLFLAAMNVEAGEKDWEEVLVASAGKGDIRESLEAAGTHLLNHLRLVFPRIMMINSSGVTIPNHDAPGDCPPPVQKMQVLCRYFTLEIKAGRMKMSSPEIQAQAFLAAFSHYAWCETLFNYKPAPPDEYVRVVVDTIVKATHLKKQRRKS